jgi:hypothetical protein
VLDIAGFSMHGEGLFCCIALFYQNAFHRLAPADQHGCPYRY